MMHLVLPSQGTGVQYQPSPRDGEGNKVQYINRNRKFINFSILVAIRRSRVSTTRMLVLYTLPAVVQNRVFNNSRQSSKKFCMTLLSIVVIYLVCNTPRLLLNFFDHFSSSLELFDSCNCAVNPVHLESYVLLSHLFLVINSSVNFILYCLMSSQFRNTLSSIILDKDNPISRRKEEVC